MTGAGRQIRDEGNLNDKSCTSILTNLQHGKTATLVSSHPRRLEAVDLKIKNEIHFSLQG